MAVGEIYRLAVRNSGVNVSGEVVNVFHFRQVDPSPTGNGASNIVNQFNTNLIPEYTACFSSSVQTLGYSARNLTTVTEGFDFTRGTPAPGLILGDMSPPQIATLIQWKTGLVGRSYRGRTYMPPPGEAAINSAGALDATIIANLGVFATQLMTIPATAQYAGFQLVIWSEKLLLATLVASFSIEGGVRTQRKRAF